SRGRLGRRGGRFLRCADVLVGAAHQRERHHRNCEQPCEESHRPPPPLAYSSSPRAGTGSTATLSGKIRQQIACIAATLQRVVAITIRDDHDEIRDELAPRAARAGKSLQEYVRGLLITAATKPSVDDVIARARARVAATGSRVDPEEIVADRDADRR